MKIKRLKIKEVLLIEPLVHEDERGYFYESFNEKKLNKYIKGGTAFVQDNHSYSTKNVLRGIHYQIPPFDQGKLVRAVQGEINDYAVDLRSSSPTFGSYVKAKLSETNKKQLWIPSGFGHAFEVLSNEAQVVYKTTSFYNKESDRVILWNDPKVNIKWTIKNPNLSIKDMNGVCLNEAEVFE